MAGQYCLILRLDGNVRDSLSRRRLLRWLFCTGVASGGMTSVCCLLVFFFFNVPLPLALVLLRRALCCRRVEDTISPPWMISTALFHSHSAHRRQLRGAESRPLGTWAFAFQGPLTTLEPSMMRSPCPDLH